MQYPHRFLRGGPGPHQMHSSNVRIDTVSKYTVVSSPLSCQGRSRVLKAHHLIYVLQPSFFSGEGVNVCIKCYDFLAGTLMVRNVCFCCRSGLN